MVEADPLLRRLERHAVGFCIVAAATALCVDRHRPAVALGILGGGVLIGTSYWAIRSAIDALVRAAADRSRPAEGQTGQIRRGTGLWFAVLKLAGRYALLGLMGYVMIARLRLHPVGLLLGASSVVAAAFIEAIRTVAKPRA